MRRLIFVILIRRSIPNVGYNQIYNNIGTEDRAQAQAFTDTWTWDDHANQCYEEILSNKNGVQTPKSLRKREKSSILTPDIRLLSGMNRDNTRNMGIERNHSAQS